MKYRRKIIGIVSLIIGILLFFHIQEIDNNTTTLAFGCVFILLADLYLKED